MSPGVFIGNCIESIDKLSKKVLNCVLNLLTHEYRIYNHLLRLPEEEMATHSSILA